MYLLFYMDLGVHQFDVVKSITQPLEGVGMKLLAFTGPKGIPFTFYFSAQKVSTPFLPSKNIYLPASKSLRPMPYKQKVQ